MVDLIAPKMVWVVGKYRGTAEAGLTIWELQGIFETEQGAVGACRDRFDFVGAVPVNAPLPQETTDWPGVRYPLAHAS